MSHHDSLAPERRIGSSPAHRASRRACKLAANCDWLAGSEQVSCAAVIVEISVSGMQVLVDERLEPGSVVTVTVPCLHDFDDAFSKLGLVAHVREHSRGWIEEVLFLNPLSLEEVAELTER